ncbi:hypothetical protein N5580_13300 [Pantoea piersonii]|uniref:Ead/Ea22-like family protein n=1 Tax=Pantoea piersonii TaxID=2364647 RepID=A0AAJ5QH68_9GAMM|nr:hypothetical protein [Pantoea piersonii]WBG90063.1 hypothetical protein N5580_13300 [Pantoea piersonii]
MSEVKRHSVSGYGRQDICYNDPEGEFVYYEDYAALQQNLNAAEAKLAAAKAVKENWKNRAWTAEEQLTEQQQKLSALAAENAGLKHAMSVTLEHVSVMDAGQAGVAAMIINDALHNSETPATDAYLNSVRADAVQALWDESLNDVGQVLQEIRAYDDASEAAGIVHSEIHERVRDFAAQLRSGEAK